MKNDNVWVSLFLVGVVALNPGCALLTKSAPIVPRYFTPELESADGAPPTATSDGRAEERLRLGRIDAGPHLRERMAYRTSAQEMGYYNDRRWTERPEAYLRRALAHSLFEERGITRAVSGAAPNLDAELVAFEEIKGEKHKVRVRVVMKLDDATLGSLERTITVEQDVSGNDEDDPGPVVRALSTALDEAVSQICDKIELRLAEIPPAAPAPGPPAGTTSTTLTTTSVPPESAAPR